MNGVNLANASHERSRRKLDYYPTPRLGTVALLNHLNLEPGTSVWEPACGDGAMSRVLAEFGLEVQSSDIEDRGFGEVRDFLADGPEDEQSWPEWVITNPPFALSEAFIRKAVSIATDGVAMLLKSQYWHAECRLKLFEECRPHEVLPLTWRLNFAPETGSAPPMETFWCVWRRWKPGMTGECCYTPLRKPDDNNLLHKLL